MVAPVATNEEAASPLVAGARAKGEYRCAECGYGVTVYTELPRCPMCQADDAWVQLDWAPFTRTGATRL
jgi:rubrerythrin